MKHIERCREHDRGMYSLKDPHVHYPDKRDHASFNLVIEYLLSLDAAGIIHRVILRLILR